MEEKSAKRVMNVIIVDESGSMSVIWDQALAGMNETLQTAKMMQEKYPDMEQRVTLVTFDTGRYKVHYDNKAALETEPLSKRDYMPRGGTPLYDAIGKTVARVNAETEKGDNVVVTIITDGEENSSEEYTLKMVKNLIEKQKEQGWTFALIGTDDLDVEGMAQGMAIDNSLKYKRSEEGAKEMFVRYHKVYHLLNDSFSGNEEGECHSLTGLFEDDDEAEGSEDKDAKAGRMAKLKDKDSRADRMAKLKDLLTGKK